MHLVLEGQITMVKEELWKWPCIRCNQTWYLNVSENEERYDSRIETEANSGLHFQYWYWDDRHQYRLLKEQKCHWNLQEYAFLHPEAFESKIEKKPSSDSGNRRWPKFWKPWHNLIHPGHGSKHGYGIHPSRPLHAFIPDSDCQFQNLDPSRHQNLRFQH